MRRLLTVLSAIALSQGLFFAILAPLLPVFETDLDMTKTQAGLLVGAFGIGMFVAALPMGVLAVRIGIKGSTLAGVLLFATASVCFGVAESFPALMGARLLQGAAGAMCSSSGLAWLVTSAPSGRRGELISLVSAARAAGQMIGPMLGALAVATGRASVFLGLGALSVAQAAAASRLPGVKAVGETPGPGGIRRAFATAEAWLAQWLTLMPSLLLASAFVLGPLRLARLGAGPGEIAVTFLLAAGLGVISRPLAGRWGDVRGPLSAVRLLLVASIPIGLAIPRLGNPWLLALALMAAVSVFGALIGPAITFATRVYEREGVAQVVAFSLTTQTMAVGVVLGSVVTGAVAEAAGDATAYGLGTVACVATLTAIALQERRGKGSRAAT